MTGICFSSIARYFKKDRQKKEGEEPTTEDDRWDPIVDAYQFTNIDDFDAELVRFVEGGVLDTASLRDKADAQNKKIALQKSSGSFEASWRPFHDSFKNNCDEVTNSIIAGAKAGIEVISLAQLNDTVGVLTELGKITEAKEIVGLTEKSKPVGFWDPSSDPFASGAFHQLVADAMANQQGMAAAQSAAAFDTEAELINAAHSYNAEAITKLADVPVSEYFRMITSAEGEMLRKIVMPGLEFRRISNASPEMREVVRRMEEALRMVSAQSKLNELRVGKYGIK